MTKIEFLIICFIAIYTIVVCTNINDVVNDYENCEETGNKWVKEKCIKIGEENEEPSSEVHEEVQQSQEIR
jgi:hypothetical protein